MRASLSCFATATALVLNLSGCVNSALRKADAGTPPAVALNIPSEPASLQATLDTVIVFDGPGSWKRRAFWDEYVVTLSNPGATPLTLTSARLVNEHGESIRPGDNWQDLERQSAQWLKRSATAENVVLAAGQTAAVVGGGASVLYLGLAMSFGITPPGLGLAAATALVSGGTFHLFEKAEKDAASYINNEFDNRRLNLSTELAPGEELRGSLFFRITPSPQALMLAYREDGVAKKATIPLPILADLHRPARRDSRTAANRPPTDQ